MGIHEQQRLILWDPTEFVGNFQGKKQVIWDKMFDCFEFQSIADLQTFRLKKIQKIKLNQLKR